MRPLGSETEADRSLRQWFDEQERHNLDRLEEGAKSIVQLVTGLYSVLFAILALSDQPAYLQHTLVRWFGGIGVLGFFLALLASIVTIYPWRIRYQQDNLSDMERGYRVIVRRKVWGLRLALWAFLVGIGMLGGVIVTVLWEL